MRPIITVVFLISLLFAQSKAIAQESAEVRNSTSLPAAPASSNGKLELIAEEPDAGTPVRIRLRGEALTYVLENPAAWSLLGSQGEVPASLVMPAPAVSDTSFALGISNPGKPQDADRIVILDRGENPQPLDFLAIEFNTPYLLTTVFPSAGPTRDQFPQRGIEQVVLQKVTDRGVLRMTEIRFSPLLVNRYIRLLIRNGADHAVDSVNGRSEVQLTDLYEVPVAFGAMRSLPFGQGSMWPLILPTAAMPLRKLKMVCDAPGEYRQVRLVRIDQDQHELSQEAEFVFADSVTANGISVTQNYLLAAGSSSGQPLALVIEDGNGTVLPLQSVKAYAAEIYIAFDWPASGQPVLSSQASRQLMATAPTNSESLLLGTYTTVEMPEAVIADQPQAATKKSSQWSQLNLQKYIPEFKPGFGIYVSAAALLLLAGLGMLLVVRIWDFRE